MAQEQEILAKVKEMVASQLGKTEDEIAPESSFIEDLGADSLDLVELIMSMEDEFGLERHLRKERDEGRRNPDEHKELTENLPIEDFVPTIVSLPVSQSLGAPAVPSARARACARAPEPRTRIRMRQRGCD